MSRSPRNLYPSSFVNSPEAIRHVNQVRHWAGTVARLPFGTEVVVQACTGIEQAGTSSGQLLSITAKEYMEGNHMESIEHVLATLAGRIGDPRISPAPPLWPILALMLLGWRDRTSLYRVIERSTKLGVEEEVYRGLAIVVYLFPELQDWAAGVLQKIPLWERALAVPLAARKLVLSHQTD